MTNKPIRILYDDQGFMEPMGGVSRYYTELMKHLSNSGVEWRLPLVSTSNAYLRAAPFSLPPHRQTINDFVRDWCRGHYFPGVSHVYYTCAQLLPRVFPSGEWANQKAVRAALREGDFDIYHLTGPHWVRDDWQIVLGKKPIVITMHDLIPDFLYNNHRIQRCRRRVLAAATHVITISETTKRDIMRLYDVPESKISVIYHGYLSHLQAPISVKPSTTEPYLLFVGKRAGYKNFAWFIKALAPLLKQGLRVKCTGSPFSADELALLKSLGVADKVSQHFFTDSEFASAYASALAFVYPSRYEGFGIPILDAFAAGCPVVLSNASCFPEVAGDAALYFDLDDEEGLRQQISRLLATDSSALRAELIAKGAARVKDFSWQKCADQTAKVYENCCR